VARRARIVRQLPVGLWAHHDRYLRTWAVDGGTSEADLVRTALDFAMDAQGHTCVRGANETECPACGGARGQV
jgi:hypothetical protein